MFHITQVCVYAFNRGLSISSSLLDLRRSRCRSHCGSGVPSGRDHAPTCAGDCPARGCGRMSAEGCLLAVG